MGKVKQQMHYDHSDGFEEMNYDQSLKLDGGKPRLDLLPVKALEAVGDAMTYGLTKYEEDSWRGVEPKRYVAAALRHIFAHMRGEHLDPESGLSHLSHAACCILFLLEIKTEE